MFVFFLPKKIFFYRRYKTVTARKMFRNLLSFETFESKSADVDFFLLSPMKIKTNVIIRVYTGYNITKSKILQ